MKKIMFSLLGALAAAQAFGFIRTAGHDLVDEKGEKFFIRGTNLGNWLNPEGYMFGFLDSCNSPRKMNDMFARLVGPHETAKFWRAFKDNYITEKDVAFIASTGANTVRLPFNYRLFTDEDYMGETGAGDGFARIDRLIGWCRKHGLRLILDMHACPGGQTGDNIDDSYDYAWLFDKDLGAPYVRHYCDVWRTIAARYKDEPVILGYDLMNEPISKSQDVAADTTEWKSRLEAIQQEAVKAIREVDKNHVVMFAGANWNTEFDMFKDFTFDPNMMFTCHHYRFGNPVYTNDAVLAYAAFRDKSGVPIFMGETGHNVPEWIKANRLAMEENNIGWTMWPYKWHGRTGKPAACFRTFKLPDGWTDVIRPFAEKNRNRKSAAQAKELPDAKEALRLMKEYAENCRFENCTTDEPFLKAIGLKVPPMP